MRKLLLSLAISLSLPSFAQDPPDAQGAPDEGAEPAVGDDVGGWEILALTGDKRLPGGRATAEPCGYLRDVVVEKGPRVERTVLEVPCVRGASGLVPGAPRLQFDVPPAPEAPPAPVPPTTSEGAAAPVETTPGAPSPAEPAPLVEESAAPEAVTDVEPREGPEEPSATEAEKPFLKGELTRFGDVQLLNRRTSFGVGLGAAGIDNVYYAVVRPDLNLHFGQFGLGLGAPLRFEVLDMNGLNALDPSTYDSLFAEAGRFRTEDWDQIEDFLRPLRYLTWGKKEDRLYVDLNRVHALTLGHGQLIRRYSPTVDIDEDNLFAQVDGYADFGGVELLAGPFPLPRVAGALVFVKPLGLFLDDTFSKSLSIGASYVTDLNAPTTLVTAPNLADGRLQLPVDDAGEFLYPHKGAFTGDMVHGVGVDAEIKAVKWKFVDLKVYGDYSHLFLPGLPAADVGPFSDGGFALGTLLRMSFGSVPLRDLDDEDEETKAGDKPREMRAEHAVRVRVEGRTFGPQYLPSYFDTLYEADKWQLGFGDTPLGQRAGLPTKIGFLATQAGQPWRVGAYLEASYAWVDWLGVTLMYEDAIALDGQAVPAARNFAIHGETGRGLGFLQLFATYHYRHFSDFSKLFQLATDNEVLYLGGRLQVLPILFVNLGVQRAFRTGFLDDDLPRQKRPLPGEPLGAEAYRFTSVGLQNSWAGTLDVELGWQF